MASLAEEMLDEVVAFACKLAKHRNSGKVEKQDVKFAFERRTKLRIPSKLHGLKESGLQILP